MKQNKIEKGKSKKETTARASESWAMGLRYAIKGNTDGTGRFLENEGSSCLLRLFSFFNNVKLPTESSNIQENDLGKLWVDLSRSCSFKSLSIYFDIFATTFCSETIVDPLQGNRRTVDQLIHQILDKIDSVFDHCTWTNRDRSSTALLKHDRSIEFETPIRLLQKFHDSRCLEMSRRNCSRISWTKLQFFLDRPIRMFVLSMILSKTYRKPWLTSAPEY